MSLDLEIYSQAINNAELKGPIDDFNARWGEKLIMLSELETACEDRNLY
jgi:hypothetical protein